MIIDANRECNFIMKKKDTNMKKTITILTVLMCFLSVSSIAQEVRGIETRRVIYDGPEYSCGYQCRSTKYYGWEFTNRNSCMVSVDISLWSQAVANTYNTIPASTVKTQSVILEPGETYVFKREEHCSTRVDDSFCDYPISSYYVEYKAYKLQ